MHPTTPRPDDGPPHWIPRAVSTLPGLVNRLLGEPDWNRSGCSVTAVLADAANPGLALARLAPAPYCLGSAPAGNPVEPLVAQLIAAHGSRLWDHWLALAVERNSVAYEHCDVGWLYALLNAAAQHRVRVADVSVTDPDQTRLLCADAPIRALLTGEPRRWPAIRYAVDVDPDSCLGGYGRNGLGQWVIPRRCPEAS
jgi:hypothetical protein